MEKLNHEAAPNNNLPPVKIQSSKQLVGAKTSNEFSEELSDGGERNKTIEKQRKKVR